MIKIVDSHLYKYLIFLKKYNPGYNVKEIFNLILGYQMALNQESISEVVREKWITDFNNFIEQKLIFEYYNNDFDKLPKNYGEIIYEHQKDDLDGLDQFYKILDEFVKEETKPVV